MRPVERFFSVSPQQRHAGFAMSPPAAEPPWRLFLALWPPPALQADFARHAALWSWPQPARRTPVERLHLTLHFLGDVAPAALPSLRQALQVPWAGCTLAFDGAAVWPGGIAVLEAGRVPPALLALHEALGEALRSCGLPVEGRRFRPHVTLARRAQGAQPPPSFEPLGWQASAPYLLVRSLPGGRGYAPVRQFG